MPQGFDRSALPDTMSAVQLTGHGGFECLRHVSDLPVPRAGAGEVLVRVRAAAVNNTDLNLRSGWYSKSTADDPAERSTDAGWGGEAVRLPLIQGADGCGQVVALGAGVEAALLGRRVLLDPIIRRSHAGGTTYEYLGTDRDGCFAEYVVVPAANAVPVRTEWSDAELASFPCSYLAAENMLERAGVGAADTVLVSGASGGVGTAAIQLARRRGARVIALAATAKTAALLALGAAQVWPRDADLPRVLGESSVDVVIDSVGGPQFPSLLRVLRAGGRYAVAGAIGGPIVPLDLRTLYLKDLSFVGCTIPAPGVFAALVGYIERGEIGPCVALRLPLSQIVAAQQAFLAKSHVGKIVLEL